MANMIANKGLPVELEPTEGLFPGAADAATAAAAAAAAARLEVGTGQGEAKRVTPESSPSQTQSPTSSVGSVAATATSVGEGASAGGRKVGGARGAGGAVDANAAWVSSNAKARERKAGSKLLGDDSATALGAAGKMRVEVSSAVLPVLQGFVPGPVTDLLAVSNNTLSKYLVSCFDSRVGEDRAAWKLIRFDSPLLASHCESSSTAVLDMHSVLGGCLSVTLGKRSHPSTAAC